MAGVSSALPVGAEACRRPACGRHAAGRSTPDAHCVAACYASFRDQLAGAEQVRTSRCDACSRVEGLDLKFVLHAGSYVVQSVGGGRELVGPEVVMAHRLLKNHAAELIGQSASVLITEAAASRLAVPPGAAVELTETYDHYPSIAARVHALG